MTKVLIVGRHTPDFGGRASEFEVVGQENVMFPTDKTGCLAALKELETKAAALEAAVLLQNVPAVLACALIELVRSGVTTKIGVIVSVPGPRQANLERTWEFASYPDAMATAAAITFANARAKTEVNGSTLKVVVDPVAQFVFSHVEWLT